MLGAFGNVRILPFLKENFVVVLLVRIPGYRALISTAEQV